MNIHFDFRIDSEYFSSEAIKVESSIKKLPFSLIEEKATLIAGPFGSTVTTDKYVETTDYRYIRGKDVQNFFIEKSDAVHIGSNLYNSLNQFHLKKNDILLTVVGAKFGQAALVNDDTLPAIFSCKSTIIRSANINPFFLVAYLLSKIGYTLIRRSQRGMAQPGINLLDVATIPIPELNITFQNKIEEIVKSSSQFLQQAEEMYSRAEQELLFELKLSDFQPNRKKTNIKNFRESFGKSGRLDAEYYQLKYEELIKRLQANNYLKLSTIVNIRKSVEPGSANYSDTGIPFLRVADYNKFKLQKPIKNISFNYFDKKPQLINELKPRKGTILFSKDGSVGTAYLLREDGDFITSGAVLHLIIKNDIIPEYLTLVLNSKLVQLQAERDAGGSIILHWRLDEIENVIIPVIEHAKQQKIAVLVRDSFELKQKSENLLTISKNAVEIAIKQGEDAALNYLNEVV